MRGGGQGRVPVALSASPTSRRSLRETLRCWREQVEALRGGSYAECRQAISGLRTLLESLEGGATTTELETVRAAFRDCRRQLAVFNASGDSQALLEAAEHLATTLSHELDGPEQTLTLAPGREPRIRPRRTPLPQAEARTRP